MSKIECQQCSRDDHTEPGCGTCGGYGYLIEKVPCEHCGHEAWMRPGSFTVYVGKRYRSFDGVLFTVKAGFKHVCEYCPKENKK